MQFHTLASTCAHIQVQKPALKWEIAIISELHRRLQASDLMFGVRTLVTLIHYMGMAMGVSAAYTYGPIHYFVLLYLYSLSVS